MRRISIKESLAPLKVPVERFPYYGNADTYFVYQTISIYGGVYADNIATEDIAEYQLTLYTRSNWRRIIGNAKRLLIESGYHIESIGPEMFDNDVRARAAAGSKYYQIPIIISRFEVL